MSRLLSPEFLAKRRRLTNEQNFVEVASAPLIREYPSDNIRSAYNNVVSVAPSLQEPMMRPALMSMVRRQLAQSQLLDPAEVVELAMAEKNLRTMAALEARKGLPVLAPLPTGQERVDELRRRLETLPVKAPELVTAVESAGKAVGGLGERALEDYKKYKERDYGADWVRRGVDKAVAEETLARELGARNIPAAKAQRELAEKLQVAKSTKNTRLALAGIEGLQSAEEKAEVSKVLDGMGYGRAAEAVRTAREDVTVRAALEREGLGAVAEGIRQASEQERIAQGTAPTRLAAGIRAAGEGETLAEKTAPTRLAGGLRVVREGEALAEKTAPTRLAAAIRAVTEERKVREEKGRKGLLAMPLLTDQEQVQLAAERLVTRQQQDAAEDDINDLLLQAQSADPAISGPARHALAQLQAQGYALKALRGPGGKRKGGTP